MDRQPTREDLELEFRHLLEANGLPQPDEVSPHEDGGILCLWHGRKVSVVIDLAE